MLKCREVIANADALLAGELAVPERLRIRLHLFLCHHCRRYVRQLRTLVGALPGLIESQDPVDARLIVETARNRLPGGGSSGHTA